MEEDFHALEERESLQRAKLEEVQTALDAQLKERDESPAAAPEMAAALAAVRKETNAPIAACIYTHFHYVGGTEVLLAEHSALPIWGHASIQANLERFSGEIAPRVTRGLVHQFAIAMPDEGPDGVVNVGLGNFFRNPKHAPFTNGYLPAQHTFDAPMKTAVADTTPNAGMALLNGLQYEQRRRRLLAFGVGGRPRGIRAQFAVQSDEGVFQGQRKTRKDVLRAGGDGARGVRGRL